jgi:hypothetical protein
VGFQKAFLFLGRPITGEGIASGIKHVQTQLKENPWLAASGRRDKEDFGDEKLNNNRGVEHLTIWRW